MDDSSNNANATAARGDPIEDTTCQNFITYTVKNEPGKIIGLILTYVLSYLLHHLLKPLSQPRIVSDIAIGLIIGNIHWIRNACDPKFVETLNFIAEFGMICHVFALGLEMNPYSIFKSRSQDALIAYAGMISSILLVCGTVPFLTYTGRLAVIGFTVTLSLALAGSGSPILTRIITNLKIGKSDIGKLVITAGLYSDLVSMFLLCFGYLFGTMAKMDVVARLTKALTMGVALLLQTIFAAKISPIFMNWVNNENPEGKPMKGSHLVLAIAFMVMVCSASPMYGYSPILSAFMAGIFLPNEGRVSKWAVGKINYLLTTVFYPVFFFWMGIHADFHQFMARNWMTWARLFVLVAVSVFGKVIGTVVCGVMLGFHWRESAELGLLLNVKGHFHVFLAVTGRVYSIIPTSTCIMVILAIFITIVQAPSIVTQIIKRARRRAPTHQRALQMLDPVNELRVLLCLHGPHNINSSINFMEITRGAPDPGIMVFVTDMVELTDQIATTLVQSDGLDTVTVTDKGVTEMRDVITNKIQTYVDESGEGISFRRMLALATFNGMGQDIFILGEDLMATLIILPFHKTLKEDGTMDTGNPGFRYVNRKVLRNAPCSIGILVDRGFGALENISKMPKSLLVAVIFIGGRDDREALAYAGRVARHPGVKLTVLRFLLDDSLESSRRGNYRVNVAEKEEEVKLDDECFAHFYERHVAAGHVAYMEKNLANSAATYSTLRSLEGQYALIIVGRGGRVDSILTIGMNDWQQCPELGPVGDVLSGSDLSHRTSVLIIQQHNIKGELQGVDDDFNIM
ncbi:Cation/H(+) antiporter 28 [Linum perenne]